MLTQILHKWNSKITSIVRHFQNRTGLVKVSNCPYPQKCPEGCPRVQLIGYKVEKVICLVILVISSREGSATLFMALEN